MSKTEVSDTEAAKEAACESYIENDCYDMDGPGPHRDTFIAGWDAAIAHERAKAEKLVEALESIAALHLPDKKLKELDEITYNDTMIARQALAEYRGEK